MKHCPVCNAPYDDTATHCADDGQALDARPDPMLGRTLASRYKILRRVGAGGMGQVYRARHVILRHDVALKLLSPELTRDPVMRERFVREAQATNLLRHPNIVDIWDVAEEGNRVFLVMEFLEGQSLADLMRTGPLDVRHAIDIAIPVCHALARAHALGVVHRDVKPENIFLARDAAGDVRVKVLDFGIVHIRGEARLTMPGEVFGTPEYLASELARGQECSPSSDLYALGVLLFEMITGTLPFEGGVNQLIAQHAHSAPPTVRSRLPSAPEALDSLVLSLMQKLPKDRPGSATDVIDVLAKILAEENTQLAPEGRTSRPGPLDPNSTATINSGRGSAPPASIPTLRHQGVTFETAAQAAFPKGDTPDALRELLERFNTNVDRLRTLEDDRRGLMFELTERQRRHDREREEQMIELRQLAVEREAATAKAAALEARERDARRDEVEVLQELALAWDSAGTVPSNPRLITLERAAQLEELGRVSARWRGLRSALDAVTTGRAAQARALASLEERRQAVQATLDALENETQVTAQKLQRRAVTTGAEISELLKALHQDGETAKAQLKQHPAARGLLQGLEVPSVA